jgi:ribosomal protein S18 acetylase RimI-like enzyme
MNQEFYIREAQKKDLDVIVSFQKAMAWETEQYALPTTTVTAGVEKILKGEIDQGTYWVIEKCLSEQLKQVVACTLILPEWSDWRHGWVWWIHSVYVDPSQRGKGLFSSLYSHLKALVEQREDLKGLRLYVDKTNLQAQKVYQQLGMNGEHYQVFEWLKKSP